MGKQTNLFEDAKKKIGDEYLWNQLVRLGDMMGDGLHYEEDGAWITKEYKKISRILIPEIKEAEKAKRKSRNEHFDKQVATLITKHKCKCGSALKQSRSGSLVLDCTTCELRYKAKSKRNE